MAYIPKDDENEQSGMNVLAPQQGQSGTNQTGSDTAPQTGSGGQSSTIGSNSGMGAQKAPKAPKSGTKSGMFTNLRKYINQNKPGAQNMANKLKGTASQENASIQQAITKQKNDFMSRVNSNRNRMNEAQQFGQNTIQSAQGQQSQEYLQQQQQDTQQRYDNIAPVNNQQVTDYQNYLQNNQQAPQDFNQYTQNQLGIEQQQQAYNQAQEQARAAEQQYRDQVNQFGQDQTYTNTGTYISRDTYQGPVQKNIQERTDDYRKRLLGTTTNNLSSDNWRQLNAADEQGGPIANLDYQANLIEQEKQRTLQAYPDQAEALSAQFDERLKNIEDIKSGYAARQEALTGESSQLEKLTGLQDQYARAQEQQRLFENKQNLQTELNDIQSKIDNAPEQLTEDDITRFNQLRTGVERFDNAILNISAEDRRVQDALQRSEGLLTNQGRRDELRKEFGARGQYSSGQASLDNLILTSDQDATRNLIQETKANAEASKNMLQEAYNTGRISIDELRQGTDKLQKELNEGVASAQDTLKSDLEQRVQTGEGTYMKELADKIQSGSGLTEEDMSLLGITGKEQYNLDPATLLSQYDPTQYNIQDVANLTDVARAQALARLSGKDNQEMLLNEQEISNRNLRAEGDTSTRTFDELNAADRESLVNFKDKLNSEEGYANVDEARSELRNNLSKNYGNASVIAPNIQQLVESGSIGTNKGTFSLDQILDGDPAAFRALNDLVYWQQVGRNGRHGANTDDNTLRRMILSAVSGQQAIKDKYSGNTAPTLAQEGVSDFENIDEAMSKLGVK